MSEAVRQYASQSSILVEAILDENGAPPCDPPDDCPVCVLVTPQRTDETRQAWLARIRDGAFRVPEAVPLRAPEPPKILVLPARPSEAKAMSVTESTLLQALTDLKSQERELSRQLMKVRGGIEAIEKLRSTLTAESPDAPTPQIAAPVAVGSLTEEPTSFPDLLREYRIRAQMTQSAVANAINANPATVCLWESGRNIPRREAALKLAVALGLSTDRARKLLAAAGYATGQQQAGGAS